MLDALVGTPARRCGGVLLLVVAAVATAWPSLVAPQLPFEDGTLLFARSYAEFRPRDWFEPYAGYLAFLPNVIASLTCRLPTAWIPLAFVLTTVILRVAAAAELLRPRWRVLGSGWRQLGFALGFVAAPCADYLLCSSLAYSQWCLLGWLCLLVAAPLGDDEGATVGSSLMITLLAWSNPLACLLLPVVWAGPRRLVRARGMPLLAAVVSYWVFVGASGAAAVAGSGPGRFVDLGRWFCVDVAFDAIVGEGARRTSDPGIPLLAWLVGALAWGAAITAAVRQWRFLGSDRRRFLLGTAGIGVASVVVAWATRGALADGKAVRYCWLVQLALLATLVVACGHWLPRRLVPVLAIAWFVGVWLSNAARYLPPPQPTLEPFLMRLQEQEAARGGRRWIVARLEREGSPILLMPR